MPEVRRLRLVHVTGVGAAHEPVVVLRPSGDAVSVFQTGDDGVAELPAELAAPTTRVLVGEARFGPLSVTFDGNDEGTVSLPAGVGRQVVLFGHVVDTSGQPAAGAGMTVTLLPVKRPAGLWPFLPPEDAHDGPDAPGAPTGPAPAGDEPELAPQPEPDPAVPEGEADTAAGGDGDTPADAGKGEGKRSSPMRDRPKVELERGLTVATTVTAR